MSENLENVAAFASCGSADPKAAPACGTACGSADPAAAPACGIKTARVKTAAVSTAARLSAPSVKTACLHTPDVVFFERGLVGVNKVAYS